MANNRNLTQEGFVKRAMAAHGNKYDYSEAVYVSYRVKVKVICKEHGPFMQSPASHINKPSGCPECAIETIRAATIARYAAGSGPKKRDLPPPPPASKDGEIKSANDLFRTMTRAKREARARAALDRECGLC